MTAAPTLAWRRRPVVEAMEPRLFLSVAPLRAGRAAGRAAVRAAVRAARAAVAAIPAHWTATPIAMAVRADGTPASTPSTGQATPGPGFTPNELRTAYGLGAYGSSAVQLDGVQGDGRGTTIAIIDAGDDPYASTDINTFSTAFGLSLMNQTGGPTFTKLGQTGTTTLPPVISGWTVEESLDIEWAHAMAPMANIVLFEAKNAGAGLTTAALTAAAYPGVVVVSMSFGGGEYGSESSSDYAYTTPAGHAGVTFLAATGDGGSEVEYPAASKNVVAVGGTSLMAEGGDYASETGWSGGGGGVSAYEPQPAYQAGVVSAYSTNERTVPDVAIDADPGTGVPVCDAYDNGATTPWLGGGYVEGGTSLACPLWAGLIAVTDQGRVAAGLTPLDGATQTLPRLYQLTAGDLHDVDAVNNGSTVVNGGVGYDLNTGIGSPVADRLVPDLAGGATVTGQLFVDANADGTFDGTDAALAGQTVYLDLNNDGVRTANEPAATVSPTGTYTFASLVSGGDLLGGLTGTVRPLTVPGGYVPLTNAAMFTTVCATTSTTSIALFPTAYADAHSSDVWTVRASPASSTQLEIAVNGTVAYTAPAALVPSLSFTFSGAGDTLVVDFGNGDPLPATGLTVTGSAAANGDALAILGTAGADAITVDAGTVLFGTKTIAHTAMPNLSVDPRGGTDGLTVNDAVVTLPAQSADGGFLTRAFSTLAIGAGGKLTVGTAAAHSDRTVLVVTTPASLSVAATGQLDLGGNDMIVTRGNLSTVAGLVKLGYAGGAWTGAGGIVSGAAAADPTRATALGVIQASGAANPSAFDGQAVAATDVLVKYTYDGDTNLDGVVNIADYTRTDVGLITAAAGWSNGDFNYDGVVDGSDYALIDTAFVGPPVAL